MLQGLVVLAIYCKFKDAFVRKYKLSAGPRNATEEDVDHARKSGGAPAAFHAHFASSR